MPKSLFDDPTFSPGPWRRERHENLLTVIRSSRGLEVCRLSGYACGEDARLIVAAPELLELVKLALRHLEALTESRTEKDHWRGKAGGHPLLGPFRAALAEAGQA